MRWGILAFMFSLYIFNFMDKSIAGYAAVHISKEFGLSPVQWGLVGSSFFWSFCISAIFGSTLTDKFGTKKMLTTMAIIWTLLQFGAFFIHNLELLIIYRIMLGIFEGPFYATAISQLNHWFAPQSRGLATSILAFGVPLGGMGTAPFLVYLIEKLGWQAAFGSLGFFSLVWLVMWIWLGKEKPSTEHSKDKVNMPIDRQLQPASSSHNMATSILSLSFVIT